MRDQVRKGKGRGSQVRCSPDSSVGGSGANMASESGLSSRHTTGAPKRQLPIIALQGRALGVLFP